jgi:hypothetical protein
MCLAENFERTVQNERQAADCFFANRAISRVHTTGTDLATMGRNPEGNQVVEQGTGPNDQLYVQVRQQQPPGPRTGHHRC